MERFFLIFKRRPGLSGFFSFIIAISAIFSLTIGAFPALVSFLTFLLLGFCALIFAPTLVLLDPPLSSNAFLLTRPVNREGLFRLKAFLLLLVGVVIPSIAEIASLLHIGVSTSLAIRAGVITITYYGAVVFSCTFLASCAQKYSDYIILLVTTILVIGTIGYTSSTFGDWPLRAFYYAPSFSLAQSIDAAFNFTRLYIAAVIFLGTGIGAYLIHHGGDKKIISSIVVGTGIVALAFEGNMVWTVYNLVEVKTDLPEEKVTVLTPKLYLPPSQSSSSQSLNSNLVNNNEAVSSNETKRQRAFFILPTKATEFNTIHHLLRFKELNITDDSGNQIKVPAIDQGYVPCIDTAILQAMLEERFGKKITFIASPDCPLGREYVFPKEVKITSDKLRKITGKVHGYTISLPIDYEFPLGVTNSSIVPTNENPVSVRNSFNLLYRSRDFIDMAYGRPISEVALLAPLTSFPLLPRSKGSPLYVHWYDSPRTYVLYNPTMNLAVRYQHWLDFDGSFIDPTLTQSDSPWLGNSDGSKNEPLPKDILKDAIILKIFPRIDHGFIADIDLTDIPIVRESPALEPT